MDTHAIIDNAVQAGIDAVVAHIAANPNQTESQACYLARGVHVIMDRLQPLTGLPVGQRPYIVLSVDQRHDALRRAFFRAVDSGLLTRTGWRAGSPVYQVAS